MQNRQTFFARTALFAALGAITVLTSQVSGFAASAGTPAVAPVAAVAPAADPAPATAAADPAFVVKASAAEVAPLLKFETVRWAGKPVQTLDHASRIALTRAAAEKAGLGEVGLSYREVYGVIEAETSWIPRTGSSKNGTPNLGLAQFEPRTAKGLGVKDPSDPVQAVFGAAMYMKEGAEWAAAKVAHLELSPEQRAAKVREGVSVYYNLSVKGRNKWNGFNAAQLPPETQKHIRNAAAGAREAAELAQQLQVA